MRKIDHTARYSAEDIAFLRTNYPPYVEDMIVQNGKTHGYDPDVPEVPEDDVTRVAIGAEANDGVTTPVVDPATSAPRLVDPLGASDDGAGEDVGGADDDYDRWKVSELEADVKARNEMPETTNVEVVGTGANGKVLKEDLIKSLRLWDAQNPGALDTDED